ncbi:hypothetical protein FCV25MIE_09441 [Fagus crenata]
MDKDGFGQRIPTELHDARCGDDNTDAILIVGQTITNLSHPCAIPLNDKGKKVMGSCSEYDVGPNLMASGRDVHEILTTKVFRCNRHVRTWLQGNATWRIVCMVTLRVITI